MLASVIGVSFISWGDNSDDVVPDVSQTTPETKEILSGDVNGIVKEKTDELVLIADTNELDITKLDSQIKSLENTKYIINSNYNTDQNKIDYVANIKLKNKDYGVDFIEGLNNIFPTYKIYLTQLFSFENPVHLEAKDSNKELDYEFGYSELKILTESTTQKEDSIVARFDTLFINDVPSQIFAYEVTNISAQPIFFSNEQEKEILDLSPETSLYSESDFDPSVLDSYFGDYNYELIPDIDNNISYHKVVTKESPEKIVLFIKDYNGFEGTKTGKIYVSDLDYEGKVYTYNKNVDVYVDYNTLGKEIFSINGYLYRGDLIQVWASQK